MLESHDMTEADGMEDDDASVPKVNSQGKVRSLYDKAFTLLSPSVQLWSKIHRMISLDIFNSFFFFSPKWDCY